MTVGKLAMAVATAFALSAVAVPALAQHDHGSRGGGGGWHGGGGHDGGGHDGAWHGGGGHDGGWRGGGFHGGHHRFFGPSVGLSFGFPFYSYWGPGYYPYSYGYPYPYSYYSDEAYDDGAPQVYIQRDNGDTVAPTSPARPEDYSYYCTNPAGYFPQVPNCPGGWLKVVPNGSPRPAPR